MMVMPWAFLTCLENGSPVLTESSARVIFILQGWPSFICDSTEGQHRVFCCARHVGRFLRQHAGAPWRVVASPRTPPPRRWPYSVPVGLRGGYSRPGPWRRSSVHTASVHGGVALSASCRHRRVQPIEAVHKKRPSSMTGHCANQGNT